MNKIGKRLERSLLLGGVCESTIQELIKDSQSKSSSVSVVLQCSVLLSSSDTFNQDDIVEWEMTEREMFETESVAQHKGDFAHL